MTYSEDGMLMVVYFIIKLLIRKDPRKGITELRYIDPQKIKKVREKISGKPNPITGVEEKQKVKSFISTMNMESPLVVL